jgi:hypothetical protein
MYGIKKITEIMDILLNNNSLLTNSKRSFYFLLEPIVGTAMMTSLSLICKRKILIQKIIDSKNPS